MERRTTTVEEHVDEFHRFDEDVRAALFGPLKKGPAAAGERNGSLGLVEQVKLISENTGPGGIRAKLGGADRALLVALVALVEIIRYVGG